LLRQPYGLFFVFSLPPERRFVQSLKSFPKSSDNCFVVRQEHAALPIIIMTISNSSNVAASVLASVGAEATETAAQTKTEAAKGDHQAIQKLARQQAQTAASAPQATVDSSAGKINTTA
jgi:hypothetical protein